MSCNIDDGDGTEDGHRAQGIDDREESGTKRGGGRERRTNACNERTPEGDGTNMETANKEVRGNGPKTQGGEDQGQPRTGNRREGYRDADGDRIREIKSIKGGGERATRWEKMSKGGDSRREDKQTKNSNTQKDKTRGNGVREGCNKLVITNGEGKKKEQNAKAKEERDTLSTELQGQTKEKTKMKLSLKGRQEEVAGDQGRGSQYTSKAKRQGGEGQGQPRTGNRREGYRDAEGHRIREIKSIRGAARRPQGGRK